MKPSAFCEAVERRLSPRQQTTAGRITRTAQELSAERGFDGFTMDDLAAACGVSRRTLFNYFGSKVDAVLGPPAEIPAERLAEFRAGGPHGNLFADLGELAYSVFETKDITRADIARHRINLRDRRLHQAVHDRFEEMTAQVHADIAAREGDAVDEQRTRLAVTLVIAVFEEAMDAFLSDRVADLGEHLRTLLREARALMA